MVNSISEDSFPIHNIDMVNDYENIVESHLQLSPLITSNQTKLFNASTWGKASCFKKRALIDIKLNEENVQTSLS